MSKSKLVEVLVSFLVYATILIVALSIVYVFETWRARVWADQMNAVIENAVNKAKKP